jgi:hypothetical protein
VKRLDLLSRYWWEWSAGMSWWLRRPTKNMSLDGRRMKSLRILLWQPAAEWIVNNGINRRMTRRILERILESWQTRRLSKLSFLCLPGYLQPFRFRWVPSLIP